MSVTLKWIRGLFGKDKTKELPKERTLAPDRNLKLARSVTFQAVRPGTSKELHLVITEVSPRSIFFKTSTPLITGEMLSITAQLTGAGMLRCQAKVDWSLENGTNSGFSGEIQLWHNGESRLVFSEFLRRQRQMDSVRVRSSGTFYSNRKD